MTSTDPLSLTQAKRLADSADTVLLRATRPADLETPIGAFLRQRAERVGVKLRIGGGEIDQVIGVRKNGAELFALRVAQKGRDLRALQHHLQLLIAALRDQEEDGVGADVDGRYAHLDTVTA